MTVTPAYRYSAICERVIDADSFILRIDVGFRCTMTVSVRLRDVDAPELSTPEGVVAKAAVEELLRGKPLVIETYKDRQSFARWIADVWVDSQLVSDYLRAFGFVKAPL